MHTREMADSEGAFGAWQDANMTCPKVVSLSHLACGHPVEFRTWESHDGAYEDLQFRCLGGGHVWWVEGPDA